MTIKIGTVVRWKSTAAGSWKTKEGTVRRVLLPGESNMLLPDGTLFAWYPNEHKVSIYLVEVPQGNGKQSKWYTPRPSALKVVRE